MDSKLVMLESKLVVLTCLLASSLGGPSYVNYGDNFAVPTVSHQTRSVFVGNPVVKTYVASIPSEEEREPSFYVSARAAYRQSPVVEVSQAVVRPLSSYSSYSSSASRRSESEVNVESRSNGAREIVGSYGLQVPRYYGYHENRLGGAIVEPLRAPVLTSYDVPLGSVVNEPVAVSVVKPTPIVEIPRARFVQHNPAVYLEAPTPVVAKYTHPVVAKYEHPVVTKYEHPVASVAPVAVAPIAVPSHLSSGHFSSSSSSSENKEESYHSSRTAHHSSNSGHSIVPSHGVVVSHNPVITRIEPTIAVAAPVHHETKTIEDNRSSHSSHSSSSSSVTHSNSPHGVISAPIALQHSYGAIVPGRAVHHLPGGQSSVESKSSHSSSSSQYSHSSVSSSSSPNHVVTSYGTSGVPLGSAVPFVSSLPVDYAVPVRSAVVPLGAASNNVQTYSSHNTQKSESSHTSTSVKSSKGVIVGPVSIHAYPTQEVRYVSGPTYNHL